jgi:4-amino-4-deoxy-L-arabinose transferase
MCDIRPIQGNTLCTVAVFLLTVAALALHIVAAFWDPFLHFWDECFHALVAKNLIKQPFTPILHGSADLPISEVWSSAHIWLHKPPFFLWLMALSIKLFGVTFWSIRIPSAIALAVMVPMTFRMGSLVFNRSTGLIAAALTTCSFYLLELGTGNLNTDHNDAIFFTMIAASWWSWLELVNRPQMKWAILSGSFAVCAFLTKWYFGLAVFGPWFIQILLDKGIGWKYFAAGLVICITLGGAWLLYIWVRFPELAAYEWAFKSTHFSIPIDGHRGDGWFHFEVINEYLFPFKWWTIIPSVLLAAFWARLRIQAVWIIGTVAFVLVFFTVAETKMISYTMMLVPIYLISSAAVLNKIFNRIPSMARPISAVLATAAICIAMFDIPRLKSRHTEGDHHFGKYRKEQIDMMQKMKSAALEIKPNEKAVIFGMMGPYNTSFMYFHGHEAFANPVKEAGINELIGSGYTIYYWGNRGLEPYP